ncbi:DUF2381 family protein [Archangium sp.]|uniref:DUF2381 family protein n=1 Tax=Archangium sp. TaxID=1872627 RepID=UPI00286BCB12|nr:DUF2381 family protein [Archangium sp.]
MRRGVWLLPAVLLSTSAIARSPRATSPALVRRTLVLPSRPGQVPPLELSVAAGVATLVRFAAPLTRAPEFTPDDGRIQRVLLEDGTWVLVPAVDLAPGERVPVTVVAEEGTEPLRFVLVTRGDAVDLSVRVVCPQPSADEDGAESVARSLLAAPDARASLVIPQAVLEQNSADSRGQVQSVLWMGQRFFATVAVRNRKVGAPEWSPVQARLRATLSDGELLEWPARLVSGVLRGRRLHALTGLLPEGASRLDVALDAQDAPGDFQPLPLDGRGRRP